MKIQMIFELPEQKDEYKMAMNGSQYLFCLQEFSEYMRAQYKSDYPANGEEIQNKLHEILINRDVTIWS